MLNIKVWSIQKSAYANSTTSEIHKTKQWRVWKQCIYSILKTEIRDLLVQVHKLTTDIDYLPKFDINRNVFYRIMRWAHFCSPMDSYQSYRCDGDIVGYFSNLSQEGSIVGRLGKRHLWSSLWVQRDTSVKVQGAKPLKTVGFSRVWNMSARYPFYFLAFWFIWHVVIFIKKRFWNYTSSPKKVTIYQTILFFTSRRVERIHRFFFISLNMPFLLTRRLLFT
jgi:hypothetical protein